MRARYEDPQDPENTTHELELSLDLYTCPLTRQIIRHPVLTTDGHRYELAYLLRYVRNGGEDSPLRAGTGGIYPVVYDRQWRELLDLLFPHHPDRYENYEIEGMIDEINDRLTGDFLPANLERVDANGRPMHEVIGNTVFKMFFYYLIFSAVVISISRELMPDSLKHAPAVTFSFFIAAILAMALVMSYLESKIRIENDN